MPLPMVHLAIAWEYAHDISSLMNCPEYYLGSISPDAIHMRKNSDRNDKRITHLRAEGDLWKENVIEFLKQNKSKPDYRFLLGYGIHILTDFIWHETLYMKFKLAYENDPTPVQDRKLAYYNDTEQFDFELYRVCEWRQDVWRLLEKAKQTGVEGILSADEINAWNSRTLHWFDSGESQYRNPIKYFSIEDLTGFIRYSADRIKNILESEGL